MRKENHVTLWTRLADMAPAIRCPLHAQICSDTEELLSQPPCLSQWKLWYSLTQQLYMYLPLYNIRRHPVNIRLYTLLQKCCNIQSGGQCRCPPPQLLHGGKKRRNEREKNDRRKDSKDIWKETCTWTSHVSKQNFQIKLIRPAITGSYQTGVPGTEKIHMYIDCLLWSSRSRKAEFKCL